MFTSAKRRFPILVSSTVSRLAALLLVLLSGCTMATIRPLDPVTGKPVIGNEDQQFNAANFAASIWDTQVLPTLEEQANDITTVLDALRDDQAEASAQYGRGEGRQPFSFMVTGTGDVLDVNLESRAGLGLIDLDGDDNADISLALGPVLRGTALRDAMPFIQFNQFTNQMEFAGVSNELNLLVSQQVLTPLGDLTQLTGKNVTFYGAFTLDQLDSIVVIPAMLTVNG